MISRGAIITLCSLGMFVGISFTQLYVTTPGWITDTEWHLWLLAIGPCVTAILCSYWVGNGRPPVDTRRDTYTQSDNPARSHPDRR